MGFLDNLFGNNKKDDKRIALENLVKSNEKDTDIQILASRMNNSQRELLSEILNKKIKTNQDLLFDKMRYEQDPSSYFWDLGNTFESEKHYEIAIIVQEYALLKSSGEWKSVVIETIGDIYLKLNQTSEALKYFNEAYICSHKNNPYRMRDLMKKISKGYSNLNMPNEVDFYNNKSEEYQRLYLEEREKSKNNPKKEDSDLPF